MASRKQDHLVVTSHHDHDVIVPPNPLRKAWSSEHDDNESDPVARAEEALASLANEFAGWMATECSRLDAAREALRKNGMTPHTRENLFHAAHDIRGEAETLGYPLAAAAADSLCLLLEETPEGNTIPFILIDRHVDAVRAIVREHSLPNAERMAKELTAKLRDLAGDYLKQVSRELGATRPAAQSEFCKRS